MRTRRPSDLWKLRAQGYETRYETFCRHNGLLRTCPGCGVTFVPARRNQKRCVSGCKGPRPVTIS